MGEDGSMILDRTGGTSQRCANPPVVYSLDQIIDNIEQIGLDCSERVATKCLLESVSYHHLKPYIQLVVSTCRDDSAQMKTTYDLLTFDRLISSTILRYIGIFEAQLKAQYSQLMSEAHGPFCIYDQTLFLREAKHRESLNQAEAEIRRQAAEKAPSISKALAKYDGKVPLWIMMEFASFGTVSKLYSNTADSEVTASVAHSFHLNKDKLVSWARTLNDVRNICAHFGPYIIRRQIPSVPKPLHKTSRAHTYPFYAVPMLEHALGSNALYFEGTNLNYSIRLHQDAADEVSDFAELHPELVTFLAIPESYVKNSHSI